MNTETVAALLLIFVPIAFNAAFALLAARFDYPDILREPTTEVLAKFSAGGKSLILIWWTFAMTAVLMIPLVVFTFIAIESSHESLPLLALWIGVAAAIVQFLGLVRWPFLVPYLAREAAEPDAGEGRLEAIDVVFQAFNRYLGVAVGEHLGYLLTGAWTLITGIIITSAFELASWLGWVGIVVGSLLMVCSLEFVGRSGDDGWKLAEKLTPIAYVIWSLWLIALGINLLI